MYFRVEEPNVQYNMGFILGDDYAVRYIRTMTSDHRNIYCIFDVHSYDESRNENTFQELWRYHMATFSWTQLDINDMGMGITGSQVILNEGYLIYLASQYNVRKCFLYNEQLSIEEFETTGDKPTGTAEVFVGDCVYIVGARFGKNVNCVDVHKLNLKTYVWEALYLAQGERHETNTWEYHTVSEVDNKLYILGGKINDVWNEFNQIKSFDLLQNVWSVVRTGRDPMYGYPTHRNYHQVVKVPFKSRLVIICGCDGGDFEIPEDMTWRFDVPSLSWKKLTNLPFTVHVIASVVIPTGKLYVFGYTESDGETRLIQTAWISEPPALKFLAFDHLTRNYDTDYLMSALPELYKNQFF